MTKRAEVTAAGSDPGRWTCPTHGLSFGERCCPNAVSLVSPEQRVLGVVFHEGDTYSYRSAATWQVVTWTRDAVGHWRSPDRKGIAIDSDVRDQLRADEAGVDESGIFRAAATSDIGPEVSPSEPQ